MRLGIIGLPQSGKTTLFNAVTRGSQPTGAITGKIEIHDAVVDVPDGWVDALTEMFKPRKKTCRARRRFHRRTCAPGQPRRKRQG